MIVLIHRQETMSLLGFPILRYIDIDDSEEVIRAIHMTDPDMPLDLVLHTPGGLVLAAYQIAHASPNAPREDYGLCTPLCHVRGYVDRPCRR